MDCRTLSTFLVLALLNVLCCPRADGQPPSKAAPPSESEHAMILQSSAGRIQIALSPQVREEMHDRLPEDQDALTIVCRELRIATGSAEGQRAAVQLECTDAAFITGRGFEGRAGRLQLDSAKRLLRLADADLIMDWHGDASPARLSAKEILLDLDESSAVLRGIEARGSAFKSAPD